MGDRPAGDAMSANPVGESGIDPVEVPITDVFDLHPFQPSEVSSVVREYLDAAFAAGLRQIRIIHGRGKGVQRSTVRTIVARDSRIGAFGDAPPEAGGWGATWIEFRVDARSGRKEER